ncbi:MAG: glycosyl transferase family 1 [Sulfobacillus thermosulfidooxidans]|uniref:Glycosyl transferase family 1 n=1 Tax=Sulfobacillus thermosulfidooxidans TaxID=28034 RepID=A0A2T2X381_SULTH|nr:MAG: glycosyl transferase family 1 [Sulfobacillus thermosulfidooxidans]
MKIIILTPDNPQPIGGIKQLYRLANILREGGWDARILHEKPGFRINWFHVPDIPIEYKSHIEVHGDDVIVIPEIYAHQVPSIAPGVKKVIYNQNAYYTFLNGDVQEAYYHRDVIGVLVVSDDNYQYLHFAFPNVPIYRIICGIDTDLWKPRQKEKVIAFMPRKHVEDAIQVLSILKHRTAFDGWKIMPIHDMTELQVAEILGRSSIFLSFGYPEGLGLPPLEAMASGCHIIGYHGGGGKEYWNKEWAKSVEVGNIIDFVLTAERDMMNFSEHYDEWSRLATQGREWVMQHYSLEREQDVIWDVWSQILVDR